MSFQFTFQRIIGDLSLAARLTDTWLTSESRFREWLQRLGWDIPAPSSLNGVRGALAELTDALDHIDLTSPAESQLQQYVELSSHLAKFFEKLRDLRAMFQGVTVPPDFFDQAPAQILDDVLLTYMEGEWPGLYAALQAFGLLTINPPQRILHFDRIPWLLQSPGRLLKEAYGWGLATFDAPRFLDLIEVAAHSLAIPARKRLAPNRLLSRLYPSLSADELAVQRAIELPVYELLDRDVGFAEIGLLIMPLLAQVASANGRPFEGVALQPFLLGTAAAATPLSKGSSLVVEGSVGANVLLEIREAGLDISAKDQSGGPVALDTTLRVGVVINGGSAPAIVIGQLTGSRLEASSVSLGLLVTTSTAERDVGAEFVLKGGALVLAASEGDAFLQAVMPKQPSRLPFDFALTLSYKRGLHFQGGAGLDYTIPVRKQFGPVFIQTIDFSGKAEENSLNLAAAVTGGVSIGPATAIVQDIGIKGVVDFARPGLLGKADLEVTFKRPDGIGIAVSSGPIAGGGTLIIDENGYKGALALGFENFSLSAFAILDTKPPAGLSYSFLASIFGQFEIQLGLGFKLTGVGGYVGLHRTASVETLRGALRDGSLDNLLFPDNPIKDSVRILETMASVFPPQKDHHLFGPCARIEWGTPSLVQAKVGIILELGAATRVLILGQIAAILPNEIEPILQLNIDFLGLIDFDTRQIALDAAIVNSCLLDWPLSGEMALRTGWGDNADFVLSVGGFHPQFPTPPNFPALKRLTIGFGNKDIQATLAGYFALTSNSAQMGACLDIYANGPHIWLVGDFDAKGNAYFDAILLFSPFAFDAALGLSLALLRNGDIMCAIGGDLRVRGPNPYFLNGKLWAEVLGHKVKISVNAKFGQERPETLPELDPLEVLKAAAKESRYWEAIVPQTVMTGVALARVETPPEEASDSNKPLRLFVDPAAGVRFSQRALPLKMAIEKLGTARLAGQFRTFDLTAKGLETRTTDARAGFAIGQFLDLSGEEQLKAPASESHVSGFELQGTATLVGPSSPVVEMTDEYETIFLDDEQTPTYLGRGHIIPERFASSWYARSFADISGLQTFGSVHQDLLKQQIHVQPTTYIVASDEATSSGVKAEVSGTFSKVRSDAKSRGKVGRIFASHVADPATLVEV